MEMPTEAEWEYAAKGGTNQKYSGSNEAGSVAWFDGNSGSRTHPVGAKQGNAYGLYDMSGNVDEWVWDVYSAKAYSTRTNATDPIVNVGSSDRVDRGGSWNNFDRSVRSANRDGGSSGDRFNDLGGRFSRSQ